MKISEAFSKADHAFLEERRRLYEQGANIELTTCLAWCFSNEVQPPSWLQQEFINSHLAVMAFEKTWDQGIWRSIAGRKAARDGAPQC